MTAGSHLRVVEPDEKFEPAPRDESLEWARFMLERLQGAVLHQLELIDEGECPQCGQVLPRLHYGKLLLCRGCAADRLRLAVMLRSDAATDRCFVLQEAA